jgi:hypothetical protein
MLIMDLTFMRLTPTCDDYDNCMYRPAGSSAELEAKLGGGYSWAPSDHPSFFPGRQATISARGQQVRP